MATTTITKTLTTTLSLRSSLKRLFSTVPTITRPPTLCPTRPARPSLIISNSTRSLAPFSATRFDSIRCRVNRSGPYSPLNNNSGGSNFSDRPPTEIAPLFPGCDYEHWLIIIDKPGGEGATKQQMIDAYIETLSKVVGSTEEAIKKIYNVSCERYFGFGCEVDEETANKMEGLPGVLFVLPDSYVDPEYKDYGGELFVNGEIVQRSPDRQRRVEPVAPRHGDRPRYNDRTRYQRRRESTR
ncbi:multiple organellar RNA editing factor 2, chloroplastic-like [Silene latifolia]|uniref:multiple organellar RNA editing factor 2, chloroplastic-like n=1 Tax=Silene latifolia TaxID=37657 RepID=UPI003D78A75C